MGTSKLDQYQRILNRFDTVARANVRERQNIVDLCRVAGISQRSLSRAFRTIRQTTALRHLQFVRLTEVRQALSSRSEQGTVTEIVSRFGYSELGRLSARYKTCFGETPSETRRQALCVEQIDRENGA